MSLQMSHNTLLQKEHISSLTEERYIPPHPPWWKRRRTLLLRLLGVVVAVAGGFLAFCPGIGAIMPVLSATIGALLFRSWWGLLMIPLAVFIGVFSSISLFGFNLDIFLAFVVFLALFGAAVATSTVQKNKLPQEVESD